MHSLVKHSTQVFEPARSHILANPVVQFVFTVHSATQVLVRRLQLGVAPEQSSLPKH